MLLYSYGSGCKSAKVATGCMHVVQVQSFDPLPNHLNLKLPKKLLGQFKMCILTSTYFDSDPC